MPKKDALKSKNDSSARVTNSINSDMVNYLSRGTRSDISDTLLTVLYDKFDDISKSYDRAAEVKMWKNSKISQDGKSVSESDYNTLSSYINGNDDVLESFSKDFEDLAKKNDKFYSLLEDYKMMPMMVPQINRVLQFIINETISPDIKSDDNFKIHSLIDDAETLKQIRDVRTELGLDKMLRDIVKNRYIVGRSYKRVIDYMETFTEIEAALKGGGIINESISVNEGIDNIAEFMENNIGKPFTESVSIADNLSIDIEYELDPDYEIFKSFKGDMIRESIGLTKRGSWKDRISSNGQFVKINESISSDSSFGEKYIKLMEKYKDGRIKRCSIDDMDPARTFKIKASGRTIGYLYVSDTRNKYSGDLIRDRLLKNVKTNKNEFDAARRKAVDAIAASIIANADHKVGITDIEELDLLHDFIMNTKLYNGDKKIKFYHKDDVFDFSRGDESILTDAVYYSKLLSSLLTSNIFVKILRGPGRQFHTVNMGVSASGKRYANSAINTLSQPEQRAAGIRGPFKTIFNSIYSANDIVYPSEDGAEKFINSEIIDGFNVDMDSDIIKYLLSAIINSFGIDSGVLDVVNNNVDFAKTITMISMQLVTFIKNEQNEFIAEFERFVREIIRCSIEGFNTKDISVSMFRPNSAILALSNDELNNAKNFADQMLEIYPQFSMYKEDESFTTVFTYNLIKEWVNIPDSELDDIFSDTLNVSYPKYLKSANIANKHIASIKNQVQKDNPDAQEDGTDDGDLGFGEDDI